jgi:hypothetical protein
MPAPSSIPNSTLLRRQASFVEANPNLQIRLPSNEIGASPGLSTIQQFSGRPTGTIPNIFIDLPPFVNTREEEDADNEGEEDTTAEETVQADRFITNALLSLLNLPTTALTRNYIQAPRTMEQFLQPVIVHPTPEQIAENTSVGNLVSDVDHACAICQDSLTAEQEGRKLNACGHWFHKSCIDTWLATNVHCPVCRHDIREPLRQQTREELEGELH